MIRALAIVASLLALPAAAADRWFYEFEFGAPLQYSTSRLLRPDCYKVVPVQFVEWYAADPRKGWEISCGNRVPLYNHFLGRRIGQPLPKLTFELGWRHMSSPMDHNEVEYDAIAVRGRFPWGRR